MALLTFTKKKYFNSLKVVLYFSYFTTSVMIASNTGHYHILSKTMPHLFSKKD